MFEVLMILSLIFLPLSQLLPKEKQAQKKACTRAQTFK